MTICAELGIGAGAFSNGVAYIASWLESLRSDRKEIFRAAAEAQRIADYLLAFHPAYAERQSAAAMPAAASEAMNETDALAKAA